MKKFILFLVFAPFLYSQIKDANVGDYLVYKTHKISCISKDKNIITILTETLGEEKLFSKEIIDINTEKTIRIWVTDYETKELKEISPSVPFTNYPSLECSRIERIKVTGGEFDCKHYMIGNGSEIIYELWIDESLLYPSIVKMMEKTNTLLELIDYSKLYNTLSKEEFQIKETFLFDNFPNPVKDSCFFPYQISREENVELTIYNILGQVVRNINVGQKKAGSYTKTSGENKAIFWDGNNSAKQKVSNGLYFYQFKAGDFSATKSMVISR